MTLPRERFRALINSRNFLRELIDPKKTPKIPKEIRHRAYWCLRHYPTNFDWVCVNERGFSDAFDMSDMIDEMLNPKGVK